MKAKKFIETIEDGEYILNKFHVKEIDIVPGSFEEISDMLDLLDDPEESWDKYGICFDFDGEVFSVDVTKFVDAMTDYFNEDPDIDPPEWVKDLFIKAEDFKGYTIYP